jgi:hypothetical protein
MVYTNIYLRLATLGLFISPIVSFPQDAISFGGATDNVKVKTDSDTVCPEFCLPEQAPVCGTDRNTYSNGCKLKQTACHSENNSLKIAHEGECIEGSGEREDNIAVKTRNSRTRNCCCIHVSKSCPNPRNNGFNKPNNGGSNGGSNNGGSNGGFPNNGGSNNGFLSAASPRFGPEGDIPDGDIGSRIVNRPTEISQEQKQQEFYCETNERACCYDSTSTLNNVVSQSRCITRTRPTTKNVFWSQRCSEREPQNIRRGEKRCGERRFREISGKKQGQANPAEFPWACLALDQNNNFLGSCAIIPDNRFNDVRSGTDRVIMAAHKLKDIRQNDQVKIRVIEYDASGFQQTENNKHEEYQVDDIVIHPQFDRTRLSHDIAVLKVVTRPDGFGGIKGRIDLTSTDDINAACLPGCNDQFNYQFNNGTGVRCWVAGWGKDGKGGKFQTIQNKVDVPLMRSSECQRKMKTALGFDAGRNFQLSESEVCAGGEEGKDACDGDGGAPLVCQSKDNRWNVVGLVTWGVDCARKGVPGVYANVYNMLDFILSA